MLYKPNNQGSCQHGGHHLGDFEVSFIADMDDTLPEELLNACPVARSGME